MNKIQRSQIIARVDNESNAVVLVLLIKNFNEDGEGEPLENALEAAKNALQNAGASVSASGSIVALPAMKDEGSNALRLDVSLASND